MPQFEDILKKLDSIESAAQDDTRDASSSKEMQDFKSYVEEKHEEHDGNFAELRENSSANKLLNIAQSAEMVANLRRDKDAAKAAKSTEASFVRQRKHNKGAKDAREIILEQNAIIIQEVANLRNDIAASMAAMAGSGVIGGGPGQNVPVVKDVTPKPLMIEGPGGPGQLPPPPGGDIIEGEFTAEFIEDIQNLPVPYTKDDAKQALISEIKEIPGVTNSRNRGEFRASQGVQSLSAGISNNSAELQSALDQNEDAKTSLGDLAKALRDMQDGKEGVKAQDVMAKANTLKSKLGNDELFDKIGGNKTLQNLEGPKLDIKGRFKSFMGIRQGTEGFKAGLSEAFSKDRLFGKADTGKLSNFSLFQNKAQAAAEQSEKEQGMKAQQDFMTEAAGIDNRSKKEQWREKWIPGLNEQGAPLQQATEN